MFLQRQFLATAALGVVAVVLAVLIGRDVFLPSTPAAASIQSVPVARGNVRSVVSGTGSLAPATQQNLSFGVAGVLSEVDVKVGDTVKAGQVLARIDPRTQQTALVQAKASLASAQATLANTLNGNSLEQAQHALDNANQSLADANTQASMTASADQSQLSSDQQQYNADNAQLQADQSNPDYQKYRYDQQAQATAQNQYNADGCSPANDSPASATGTTCQKDRYQYNAATAAANTDSQSHGVQQEQADQARVTADLAKITADQNRISTDQFASQRSIEQAQNAVTGAQDSLNNQSLTRPNTIAQQQAAIVNAQAALDSAQYNLDHTTLTAPADGTVSSLSGQPGESVGATSAATTLAPGSTAAQPSSGSGTGSSSSSFMVLTAAHAFQVIVPFAEADAGRIKSGQDGSVTFDAITGLTIPVHVLAVANTATTVSNVVNYYVTLTLDSSDARLRGGLTSNVTVNVASATNVLSVPNRAITRRGNRAFVTVLGAGGKQVQTAVTTGVVGDTSTEITDGVVEGDRVVLPALRTSTATTGAAGRTGVGLGGGGLGGGAIGGGRAGG